MIPGNLGAALSNPLILGAIGLVAVLALSPRRRS
jgi:hypothetical protein